MSDSRPQFHTWPPSSLGRWLADRPIFHLVLNWARNLYPYFADTEGAEGGRHRRHLGSKRASERRRDACRKFWQRQRNCNCANHAPPSVRPSVSGRPSIEISVPSIPPLSPPSQSTLCQLPRVLQRAQILRGFPMLIGIPTLCQLN